MRARLNHAQLGLYALHAEASPLVVRDEHRFSEVEVKFLQNIPDLQLYLLARLSVVEQHLHLLHESRQVEGALLPVLQVAELEALLQSLVYLPLVAAKVVETFANRIDFDRVLEGSDND